MSDSIEDQGQDGGNPSDRAEGTSKGSAAPSSVGETARRRTSRTGSRSPVGIERGVEAVEDSDFAPADGGRGLRVMMLDPSAAIAGLTHNLCNSLAERGSEVHLYTSPFWRRSTGRCNTKRYEPKIEFYQKTQMRAHAADSGLARLFWKLAQFLGHLWTLLRLIPATRRYDVVHLQWTPVPAVDVLWLWLVSRWATVAYTVHNLLPHDTDHERRHRIVYGLAYRSADILFVHTRGTARGLEEEFGVSPEKVVRIRHGSMTHLLDLDEQQPSVPIAHGDAPVILFLGQIHPYKGVDILLKAANHLRRHVWNFRVVVAGKPGMDMSPHEDLVRDLGLERLVEFRLGYIEENELPAYFRQATVMAFPYREVDQSGVAISACTFGKAIVASRIGGLAEIVEEADNGILVQPESPVALARGLQEVLEDEDRRRRFETNSLIYARTDLSWRRIAGDTAVAYRRVVDGVEEPPAEVGARVRRAEGATLRSEQAR